MSTSADKLQLKINTATSVAIAFDAMHRGLSVHAFLLAEFGAAFALRTQALLEFTDTKGLDEFSKKYLLQLL